MAKKTKSKPMHEIISRIKKFDWFTVDIFDEHVILTEPVENWPLCDVFISFHSAGFPLDKAQAYADLRNPLVVNDISMQNTILSRVKVYKTLQEFGIDVPRYVVCDRSDPDNPPDFEEFDDHIEVNGQIFHKPFVEKPVSAEDHNIIIYFQSPAGGGSQRLFRKVGNRSSEYCTVSTVRRDGSYIYEEFQPTDGTDVKIYTVGPEYAHAEARKSPALDGKVERDKNGKEIRYPVLLSAKEKHIARKVCLAFKQTICGFDLLRANGNSYVCDVNGFSFVKNSQKYYDDSAKVLGNLIMRQLGQPYENIALSCPSQNIPHQPVTTSFEQGQVDTYNFVPTTNGQMMELRCVVGVIRHGDRTPKQKMKISVKHPKWFELFEKYDGYRTGKLKLKRPKHLQEVLDTACELLMLLQADPGNNIEEVDIDVVVHKYQQMKNVLEMYGHFSGINRKVQFKLQKGDSPTLQVILKWGGELTNSGKNQAEELGRAFRCMYPGGQGDYAGFPGCGLLRLHSTYRHDLKIYASDEGRVQMTAAAFAKGLLALEGELPPILVQMVKSANTNGLLDDESEQLGKYQNR